VGWYDSNSGTQNSSSVTASIPNPTGWNHVQCIAAPYTDAATTSGVYLAVVINGSISGTATINDGHRYYFIAGSDNVNIGKVSDYWQLYYNPLGLKYFDGWIDDFYVYNNRISTADLLDLYTRGRSMDY
jgi:hypothetical protein